MPNKKTLAKSEYGQQYEVSLKYKVNSRVAAVLTAVLQSNGTLKLAYHFCVNYRRILIKKQREWSVCSKFCLNHLLVSFIFTRIWYTAGQFRTTISTVHKHMNFEFLQYEARLRRTTSDRQDKKACQTKWSPKRCPRTIWITSNEQCNELQEFEIEEFEWFYRNGQMNGLWALSRLERHAMNGHRSLLFTKI